MRQILNGNHTLSKQNRRINRKCACRVKTHIKNIKVGCWKTTNTITNQHHFVSLQFFILHTSRYSCKTLSSSSSFPFNNFLFTKLRKKRNEGHLFPLHRLFGRRGCGSCLARRWHSQRCPCRQPGKTPKSKQINPMPRWAGSL